MTIHVSRGSLLLVETGTNESTGTTIKLNQHDLNNSYHGLQVEEGALEEKYGTFLTAVTTASASTTAKFVNDSYRFTVRFEVVLAPSQYAVDSRLTTKECTNFTSSLIY
jgi:hypothetical protein